MMKYRLKRWWAGRVRRAIASRSSWYSLWLRHLWRPAPDTLEAHLARHSRPGLKFLQVGANDGLVNDPLVRLINRDGWEGVLVEPQELVFRRELQPMYAARPGLRTVQAAVDEQSGSRTLYTVSFSTSRWATGLASFVRGSIEARIADGYIESRARMYGEALPQDRSAWISAVTVPCVTFDSLMEKHGIRSLDLLQIDVEGFDDRIIAMFPFERIRPRLVSFENEHMNDAQMGSIRARLGSHGYEITAIRGNSLAVLRI